MKTKLVCYSLGNANSKVRRNFHREMYGYRDVSCNGKYIYQRKGVLSKLKHKKILDSIIITNDDGSKTLSRILKKYNAKFFVFSIFNPFKN